MAYQYMAASIDFLGEICGSKYVKAAMTRPVTQLLVHPSHKELNVKVSELTDDQRKKLIDRHRKKLLEEVMFCAYIFKLCFTIRSC